MIATGGTVLKEENVDALRAERHPDICKTQCKYSGHQKMEKERLPYYRTAADITFNNVRSQSKGKLTEDLEKIFKAALIKSKNTYAPV